MDELLTLPGVGRKTANLVLILAYESRKNICVDTHVHRIANRLGWVRTKTPDETEQALYRATESRWWPYINLYLVTWGQNVSGRCYPRCPACAIKDLCPRIGVTVVSKTRPEQLSVGPAMTALHAQPCWRIPGASFNGHNVSRAAIGTSRFFGAP